MKKQISILLLLIPALVFAQQKEAEELWNLICQKAGIQKTLIFKSDPSIPEGSYKIKADSIWHNSGNVNNPGSTYAVARIAEELFDAVMLYPSPDGITIRKREGWKNIEVQYMPKLVRNNYVNRPNKGWDKLWMHWHHIPTIGSGDGTFWHTSWFIGMAKKYPQLAPKTGIVEDKTKPDITHPDFAKCIYQEWTERGRPSHCNLFEIDGTRYWWALRHIATPTYLNPGEANRFETAISSNIRKDVEPGETFKLNNIRYQLSENLTLAQTFLPINNKAKTATNTRFNLTAFYLRMYQQVRAYFDAQGDTSVTFNILAYSAYRCLPTAIEPNLNRFHVYYVSPNAANWAREDMLDDAQEFLRWKKTGAKAIWRPNFIFQFNGRLTYPLLEEYIKLTLPDGLQVPPYSRPAFPFGNGMDYYVFFRTMQGMGYDYYLQGMPPDYRKWHDKAIEGKVPSTLKDEDDL